jgi:hypothetical protein
MELADLINQFSLDEISRSPAIFDIKKAAWVNSQYIRKLGISELTEPHRVVLADFFYSQFVQVFLIQFLNNRIKLFFSGSDAGKASGL